MTIISRLSRIIKANVNELLEKADSPETAIERLMGQLEDAVQELRDRLQAALSVRQTTEEKVDEAEKVSKVWQKQAEDAVRDGRDDVAVVALQRAKDNKQRTRGLQDQLRDAEALIKQLQQQLRSLETRLREAKVKKDALLAKLRSTELKQQAQSVVSAFNEKLEAVADIGTNIDANSNKFDRYADEMERQLAELDALTELQKEAADPEPASDVDDDIAEELAALKAKVKKQKTKKR